MTPPKGKIYVGNGDFRAIGDNIVKLFLHYNCLKKSDRVLDIGCGIGRVAVPITKVLNTEGSYEGLDIVKAGIDWCNKHIAAKYSNFKFKHIPIKNDLYNLNTNQLARDFKFPYNNSEFDFVFLTSVFTHMLPEDVSHYLHEIYRVLKKGGKCYTNFFLLDDAEEKQITKHHKVFKYPKGNYWLFNKSVKEANVAFKKKYVFEKIQFLFELEKFVTGYWKDGVDKLEHNDYQDIIIFRKK